MRNWKVAATFAAAIFTVMPSTALLAQEAEQPWSMVSLYHVAPGKHMEFLKWMQQQEAISQEAGVAPTQWYAHVQGDNWDFVAISPLTTEEQDKKIEALSTEKGVPTGFKAGLKFRTTIQDHTDTMAVGPVSIDDLVKAGSD